jgi:chorismate mutase
MSVRGIRGAITADANTKDEIIRRTKFLLSRIARENELGIKEIASIIFTVTDDLDAEFPAVAARKLGWMDVPLLCGYEIDVPGSLRKCIRVLLHVNTESKQSDIKHVYLRAAKKLRR